MPASGRRPTLGDVGTRNQMAGVKHSETNKGPGVGEARNEGMGSETRVGKNSEVSEVIDTGFKWVIRMRK